MKLQLTSSCNTSLFYFIQTLINYCNGSNDCLSVMFAASSSIFKLIKSLHLRKDYINIFKLCIINQKTIMHHN
jgi:hypothetical protein